MFVSKGGFRSTLSTPWKPERIAAVVRGLRTTQGAHVLRITAPLVGAWKRDFVDDDGVLDRNRRAGGWSAVAVEVRGQVGGQWTARSLTTVKEIVGKARSFAGVAT